MAFSVVQKAISADITAAGSTITLTFSSAITAGSDVVGSCQIFVSAGGAFPSTTVTDDKGNSYAIIDQLTDTAPNTAYAFGFHLENVPAGGPTVITITPTGGHSGFSRASAIEVSGAGGIDQHASQLQSNISSTTVSSPNITPSQTGTFLYGWTQCTDYVSAPTITVGSGYTIENVSAGTDATQLADEVQFPYNSVTAINSTFTSSASGNFFDFVTGIITLKPAAAAATFIPRPKKRKPRRLVRGTPQRKRRIAALISTPFIPRRPPKRIRRSVSRRNIRHNRIAPFIGATTFLNPPSKSWVWNPQAGTFSLGLGTISKSWVWNHQAGVLSLALGTVSKTWVWAKNGPTLSFALGMVSKAWNWVARPPTINLPVAMTGRFNVARGVVWGVIRGVLTRPRIGP